MPRRHYASPRRADQARQTRVAIIRAAFRLFLKHGYAATSIEAIARAAGVSERTVYVAFTDKVSLVTAIADYFFYGGTQEGEGQARFLASVQTVPDPIERLRRLVHRGAVGMEQGLALIARMVRAEAPGDARLRHFVEGMVEYRHQGTRALGELVLGRSLPEGEATELLVDEVEAINSEEVYLLLVGERGWSRDRYEAWKVDMILIAMQRHGVELPAALGKDKGTEHSEAPGTRGA
jgi:AcrR family transcriptional regulator